MDFGEETALLFNHEVFARVAVERYLCGGRHAGTLEGSMAEEQVHAGLSEIFHGGVRSLQIDQVPQARTCTLRSYTYASANCTYQHARMHSGTHSRIYPSMSASAPTRTHAHIITTPIDRIWTRGMES
jgi:hypothetical protein